MILRQFSPSGVWVQQPLQFGLGGFLEFAALFMPLLALGSIVLLTYWALGKFVLPRLLRGRPSSGSRIVFATPLVAAIVFILASFLTTPTGYWGLFVYLVVLTGMIEGGVLVSRIAKLVSQIPDLRSKSDSDSDLASDQRHRARVVKHDRNDSGPKGTLRRINQWLEDRFGVGLKKIFKKIGERILKWWYKRKVKRAGTLVAITGALVVYFIAEPRVASTFRLAELVLSTLVAIATVNILLWKLTELTLKDDPAVKMDVLPVIGALLTVSATTTVRLPDTYLPGADRIQSFLAQHVSYAQRIVEALFTLPLLDIGVILLHFVGVVIGALIALYVWRRERRRSLA